MDTQSEIANPAEVKFCDRRSELRFEVRINANVSHNDFSNNSQITNLSFSGMRIKTKLGLMRGDLVIVTTLNGRSYPGRVIWSIYPLVGLVFDEKLAFNDPIIEKYIGVDKMLSEGFLDPLFV
ncbi:MAG: PilZ domain-containing protein [Aeoliella sp.]